MPLIMKHSFKISGIYVKEKGEEEELTMSVGKLDMVNLLDLTWLN